MEIRKCFEINEHENIIYQNLWDELKVMFREKSMLLNAYIRNKSLNQSSLLKKLETKSKLNKSKQNKENN